MLKTWRVHFLHCEKVSALVFSLGFAVWDHRVGAIYVDSVLAAGGRASLYGTLASIFGALLGFVITAVSILLSFAAAESLKLLRESNHYGTLWKTYKSGVRATAFATAAAVVALVLDRDQSHCRLALYATVAASLFAIVRLARCIWILEKVIDIVGAPRK